MVAYLATLKNLFFSASIFLLMYEPRSELAASFFNYDLGEFSKLLRASVCGSFDF